MIAREHEDAFHPLRAQTPEGLGSFRPQQILHRQQTNQLAAITDVKQGFAFGVELFDDGFMTADLDLLIVLDEVPRADDHPLTLNFTGHPMRDDEFDLRVIEVFATITRR